MGTEYASLREKKIKFLVPVNSLGVPKPCTGLGHCQCLPRTQTEGNSKGSI